MSAFEPVGSRPSPEAMVFRRGLAEQTAWWGGRREKYEDWDSNPGLGRKPSPYKEIT
jgi:hypothetical protein